MIQRLDLSVGQRLGLGFGLLLLLCGGMLAVVGSWNARSAEIQQHYSTRIQPLQLLLRELDRAVYKVAVNARRVLLTPEPERVQEFEGALGEARVATDVLARAPTGTVEPEVRSRVVTAARRYLDNAAQVIAVRAADPAAPLDERSLTRLRMQYLTESELYGHLQEEHGRIALQDMATLREQGSRGLLALALLGSLLMLLLAWITVRSVSRPATALLATVASMERGDWRPALELAGDADRPARRDEMARLRRAFGSAAHALEHREQRLRAEGRIAKGVSASLERERVAQAALDAIVAFTGAELGVVYTCPPGGERLEPAASHALAEPAMPLRMGEGVPGQAARARAPLVVDGIPPDAGFQVRLGFDQAPARAAAAVPLLFGDQLRGVLVLASLRPFGNDVLDFLQAAAGHLAMALQNAHAHGEVQALLERVRESHEKIQAQNEELQAQNEEIQAQSEELQAQGEEIQAQNEELMQQREELRAHAEQLSEADERKDAFLGVLAHELRNPMAAIGNGLFVLQRAVPASGPPRRALDIIARQSRQLVRLIDDLLDITRITQGKIQLQRERLDLRCVVESCVEDQSIAAEQAQIRLEVMLPDASVPVEGDRTRLCQVLGNLLANSIKFGSAGDTIQVWLQAEPGARQAVLSVTDQGEGIAPDMLPRLFQPFSQGISGLDRARGGLGLGLALVKSLVQLHRGSVEAHSDGPGQGARFTVRLPLAGAEREAADAIALARPAQQDRDTTSALAGCRVLVIEDNPDVARSLEEALRATGCEVSVAASAAGGLRRAAEWRPDAVLCDIGLPVHDGYHVARELRTRGANAGVLLIALTGYASSEDRERARAAGFDHHVAKPLDLAVLARLVASHRALASAG